MWTFDSTAFTFDNNTTSYTFDGGAPGLYSSAAAAASLTNQLTNWSTVQLQSPLVGGIGSALDPYLWTTPSPGIDPNNVGTTLYYDGTNMVINPDGTIQATSNNFSAVIQFYSPAGVLGYAVYVAEPSLVTYMQASGGAYGSLSGNPAQLIQAVAGLANLSATLTAQIALAQNENSTAALTNALATSIQIAEQAGAVASLTNTLTASIHLNEPARAIANLANQLTTRIPLAMTPAGRAALTNSLTNGPRFLMSAAGHSTLTSALKNGPRFAQTASAIAGLVNRLTTQIPLATRPSSVAGLSASLTVSKGFSVAFGGVASSQSTIRTGAGFETAMDGVAGSTGYLLANINLATIIVAGVATLKHDLLTFQVLTVPVLLSHQVPGVYNPGEIPTGQFDLPVGEKSYYGIDWTYWICYRWQPGFAATLGYVVRPFPWTGYEYICTVAGQTGNYQPVWPTLIGQIVGDGNAAWTCQAIGADSLADTVASATWTAPAGITVTAFKTVNNFTPVLIDATTATANTTYEVDCTAVLASGEFLIGKLYMNVY